MGGNISDSETTKIDVVYGDCISYDLAICSLQETHINGEPQIITREKGSFFLCGNMFPESYHYGLGFYVQKELLNYVSSYCVVSPRLAYLCLHTGRKGCSIAFINAYAPTMNSHRDNPQKTEVFYRDLKQLHQQLQKKHSFVLLGGDFNAKLDMK